MEADGPEASWTVGFERCLDEGGEVWEEVEASEFFEFVDGDDAACGVGIGWHILREEDGERADIHSFLCDNDLIEEVWDVD